NRFGDFEIMLLTVETLESVRLTVARGDDFSPTWSANGDQIAFSSNRSGTFKIYMMSSTGDAQVMISNPDSIGDDIEPDWQPVP
ncbi:MAG: hypothetical protein DWG81_02325, partial [Chloroflexi bacterium]|nr:hypothetical protein [Chloroflexota bacterium]